MQSYNPTGTEGFDFLEFSATDPVILERHFLSMGFIPVAKHLKQNITIFQQNDIKFIVNLAENSLASQFAELHGASTSAMGFRVKDADAAFQHAIAHGAKVCSEGAYRCPAIFGVGGSIIYFVDCKNNQANYMSDFVELSKLHSHHHTGLTYIDHVTHNLYRGNMNDWAEFYENIFNFREIRYFDIEGKLTGLKSRAMTSPCGNIRIPLNESSDDKSQIEEFLKDFKGEGIQHIALGTKEIFTTVEQLKQHNLQFLDTPDTYYDLLEKRLPKHGENVDQLRKYRILLDGVTQPEKRLLLQIFTKNMLGPVFFEIIQRKGDEGFGEGNFKALFESIELDQINRGVLTMENEK